MQSIGERFEEARKRKGISLREAAEATKIRSDFLANIEQDKFDFELPDIYKRGFLKNYARYLKLDTDHILTDYHAHVLGKSHGNKKGAELFGSMEVKGTRGEHSSSSEEPSYGHISAATPMADAEVEEDDDSNTEEESDKIFYIKAGLVAVGTLALVVVIFSLIKAILGSDAEVETADLRESPAITETAASTDTATEASTPKEVPTTSTASEDSITLIASGNVFVAVKQSNDGQVLLQKTLAGGETVTVTKTGPVVILFTAGENLVVVDPDGVKNRPEGAGFAKMTIQ